MNSIAIRLIEPNELASFYTLRNEILRKPLGLDLFQEDLASEWDQIKIGAFHQTNTTTESSTEEQLVGCVMLVPNSDGSLKLRQMAVQTNVQRGGIGSALVGFAEAWAVQNGYRWIKLHARLEAMAFYQRLQYHQVGEMFIEVGIPHCEMVKSLE